MTFRVAGIELGGTKSIAVLHERGGIAARHQIATADPSTYARSVARDCLRLERDLAPLAAVGLASFGPLRLDPADPDFGCIGATPKPGWTGIDVRGPLARQLEVPIGFDTDVAGAALAEGRWGASQGCSDHVYVTVGTGVGLGIVAGGRLVHGGGHPEGGHVRIRRRSADGFAGTCPFHGDCLEGLVSGPALAARTGIDSAEIADDHPVWSSVVDELAEAMTLVMLILSPQRIVFGGGVMMKRPQLVPQIAARVSTLLGGYLSSAVSGPSGLIVAAGLGEDAGPLGAIALALAALDGRAAT